MPNSVTTIGSSAFYDCSGLQIVTIGTGVTSIGGSAFGFCNNLQRITIDAVTPPTLTGTSSTTFPNNGCPIYVPAESVNAYKTASGWSNYASRIQAIA